MDEKLLLIERKFEKLKFTNEKNSVDFENNEANNRNNNSNVDLITMATVKVENNNKTNIMILTIRRRTKIQKILFYFF